MSKYGTWWPAGEGTESERVNHDVVDAPAPAEAAREVNSVADDTAESAENMDSHLNEKQDI